MGKNALYCPLGTLLFLVGVVGVLEPILAFLRLKIMWMSIWVTGIGSIIYMLMAVTVMTMAIGLANMQESKRCEESLET